MKMKCKDPENLKKVRPPKTNILWQIVHLHMQVLHLKGWCCSTLCTPTSHELSFVNAFLKHIIVRNHKWITGTNSSCKGCKMVQIYDICDAYNIDFIHCYSPKNWSKEENKFIYFWHIRTPVFHFNCYTFACAFLCELYILFYIFLIWNSI